jgi:hypothetical protein
MSIALLAHDLSCVESKNWHNFVRRITSQRQIFGKNATSVAKNPETR